MGWVVAIIVIGLVIGGLVGGTVLHPFLYGFFIAGLVIIPLWACSSIINGIVDSIFGKRS